MAEDEVTPEQLAAIAAENEEPEPVNYKAPAQKSVKEIHELDKDDESLRKYKEVLLGSGVTEAGKWGVRVKQERLKPDMRLSVDAYHMDNVYNVQQQWNEIAAAPSYANWLVIKLNNIKKLMIEQLYVWKYGSIHTPYIRACTIVSIYTCMLMPALFYYAAKVLVSGWSAVLSFSVLQTGGAHVWR